MNFHYETKEEYEQRTLKDLNATLNNIVKEMEKLEYWPYNKDAYIFSYKMSKNKDMIAFKSNHAHETLKNHFPNNQIMVKYSEVTKGLLISILKPKEY